MTSTGSVEPDDDEELDPCAYCGRTLHRATDEWVFVDASWGSLLAHAQATFTFCTQAHASAYLAENRLPEPKPHDPPLPSPRRRARPRHLLLAALVLVNLGFYVLGVAAWLRWVWR